MPGRRAVHRTRLSGATRAWLIVIVIVVLLAIVVVSVWAVVGNRGGSTGPTSSTETSSDLVTPSSAPVYDPKGGAVGNEALFNWVNQQTIAQAAQKPTGQQFINALIAAGFDRSNMQLTPDTTAAGLQADSIQFSVQFGTDCLIGQWGSGSNGYQVERTTAIDGIGCLIGKTRPIDW